MNAFEDAQTLATLAGRKNVQDKDFLLAIHFRGNDYGDVLQDWALMRTDSYIEHNFKDRGLAKRAKWYSARESRK